MDRRRGWSEWSMIAEVRVVELYWCLQLLDSPMRSVVQSKPLISMSVVPLLPARRPPPHCQPRTTASTTAALMHNHIARLDPRLNRHQQTITPLRRPVGAATSRRGRGRAAIKTPYDAASQHSQHSQHSGDHSSHSTCRHGRRRSAVVSTCTHSVPLVGAEGEEEEEEEEDESEA